MVQYQWVNQPPPTTMMIRLLVQCYTIYIYIYYRAAEIKEILLEKYQQPDIDGLVQHWSNSTAKALRLLQFCTKPSIYWLRQGPFPTVMTLSAAS